MAMKRRGQKRQAELLRRLRESSSDADGGAIDAKRGMSVLPDQTSETSRLLRCARRLAVVTILAYLLLNVLAKAFFLVQREHLQTRLTMPLETASEIARSVAADVEGRTFVVTGASSGIGEATASALASAAAFVIDTIDASSRAPASVSVGEQLCELLLRVRQNDSSVAAAFLQAFLSTMSCTWGICTWRLANPQK